MHAFKYTQIDDFIKQMLNRPEIFDIISSRNYEFDIVEEYIQNYFRRMAFHEIKQDCDRENVERLIMTLINTSDHIFMTEKRKRQIEQEKEQQRFLKSF